MDEVKQWVNKLVVGVKQRHFEQRNVVITNFSLTCNSGIQTLILLNQK